MVQTARLSLFTSTRPWEYFTLLYLCADEVTANIALNKNNYLHHIWYMLLISTHAIYICEMSTKFISVQVETKCKNITKRYRDAVDHNRISGNERKSCPYFDVIDELDEVSLHVAFMHESVTLHVNCDGNVVHSNILHGVQCTRGPLW